MKHRSPLPLLPTEPGGCVEMTKEEAAAYGAFQEHAIRDVDALADAELPPEHWPDDKDREQS